MNQADKSIGVSLLKRFVCLCLNCKILTSKLFPEEEKKMPYYFEQFCLGLSGSFRWWCSQKPMKVKELSLQVASIISGLQPNALLTLSDPLFPTQEMYVLWAISNAKIALETWVEKVNCSFIWKAESFFFLPFFFIWIPLRKYHDWCASVEGLKHTLMD